MKSLFEKKEIKKNEAGKIVGSGGPTEHEQQTIGMRHTGSWSLFWGYISDSEYASDSETVSDCMGVDCINQ
jgi:hypothetical protein